MGEVVPLGADDSVRGIVLLIAFAWAVMENPVSSVAYAIEAPLRALDGHLEFLLLLSLMAALAVGDAPHGPWVRADRPPGVAGALLGVGAAPPEEEPVALDRESGQ
jgi:hypothetical protein